MFIFAYIVRICTYLGVVIRATCRILLTNLCQGRSSRASPATERGWWCWFRRLCRRNQHHHPPTHKEGKDGKVETGSERRSDRINWRLRWRVSGAAGGVYEWTKRCRSPITPTARHRSNGSSGAGIAARVGAARLARTCFLRLGRVASEPARGAGVGTAH
jgi:hypothetical protein